MPLHAAPSSVPHNKTMQRIGEHMQAAHSDSVKFYGAGGTLLAADDCGACGAPDVQGGWYPAAPMPVRPVEPA